MTEANAERVLEGVAASSGLAIGPVMHPSAVATDRIAGGIDEEAAALQAALDQACEELFALMDSGDKLAAEILEFQTMLLEDEDLIGPVSLRISGGEAADRAWRAVLDAEIADYVRSEDEYLSARASDLADLRDRVLCAMAGVSIEIKDTPEAAILVADDLTPSAFLGFDWSRLGGVALFGCSPTSHVAILARARGVPMVVGMRGGPELTAAGETAALDGDNGVLTVAPSRETLAAHRLRIGAAAEQDAAAAKRALQPAVTASGRAVLVMVNIDDPSILDSLSPEICDGVGLTRTEFLFRDGDTPDEARQFDIYTRIVRWAEGRPVTIRTLDAGGDKPIPGVTVDGESNPFLGVRGLRLSLIRPELFRVQLRALCRAAALGSLKVMVPMVTTPHELAAAAAHLDAVVAELATEGVEHARPALGIMVETPAAALTAADWEADFYSIGSNDLIQYVTAAGRDNPEVASLADPRNPAVLELIRRTIEAGRSRGVEVSLCGDMASAPDLVPVLLDLGLETFSVAPAQVGRVKFAIGESG